jgi:hypothetical protein
VIQPSNIDLIYDFIESNPRCTRKQLMEATNLCKTTLGKNLKRMMHSLIVEIELDSRNRPVEYYTINLNADCQRVVVKPYEPIKVKHHPLFAMYGMTA